MGVGALFGRASVPAGRVSPQPHGDRHARLTETSCHQQRWCQSPDRLVHEKTRKCTFLGEKIKKCAMPE